MDLSKVLGDVYEADGPETAARRTQAAAPQWSDEAHLDEVFASWTPGPPESAPAAEREMLESLRSPVPVEDAVAAALSAALIGQDPSVGQNPSIGSESPLDPLRVDLAPLTPVALQPATPASWYAELQDLEPAPPEPTDEVDGGGPAPVRSWTRQDDDILPAGAKGKTPKVKAEKTPKVKAGRGRHARGHTEATAADPVTETTGEGAVAAADPTTAPKTTRSLSLRWRRS